MTEPSIPPSSLNAHKMCLGTCSWNLSISTGVGFQLGITPQTNPYFTYRKPNKQRLKWFKSHLKVNHTIQAGLFSCSSLHSKGWQSQYKQHLVKSLPSFLAASVTPEVCACHLKLSSHNSLGQASQLALSLAISDSLPLKIGWLAAAAEHDYTFPLSLSQCGHGCQHTI